MRILSQLEARHETFAKRGPCSEVIRLDGSQSKNRVLENALIALKGVWHRHQDHSANPGLSRMHPPLSPLTPYLEQKRDSHQWDPPSPTLGSTIDPLIGQVRTEREIWISFIGRPYRKVTIPPNATRGSEVRSLIAKKTRNSALTNLPFPREPNRNIAHEAPTTQRRLPTSRARPGRWGQRE